MGVIHIYIYTNNSKTIIPKETIEATMKHSSQLTLRCLIPTSALRKTLKTRNLSLQPLSHLSSGA